MPYGESLVRALVVVAIDELVEPRLLLQDVFCGGSGGLELQGRQQAARLLSGLHVASFRFENRFWHSRSR